MAATDSPVYVSHGTFILGIVDNDEITLRSLAREIKELIPAMRIAWLTSSGAEAVRKALGPVKPNIVLVDMSMEDMPGLMVCRRIRQRTDQVKLLAMTSFSLEVYRERAVRAGAQGIVSKSSEPDIIRGLLAMARNETYGDTFESAALSHIRLRSAPQTQQDLLSGRETQVMDLVSEGLDDRQIAAQLNIAEPTVRKHAQTVMRKLHVHNRVQAVLRWLGEYEL